MIKQAEEHDTLVIEEILLDAVMWMEKNKLQNQWNEDSIKWSSLSKDYQINDFYIDYQDGVPVGCMAITDLDTKYWAEIPKGKSLYLHKLAVKREVAGKGVSKELIKFAQNLLSKNGINFLRLDCNSKRNKLRMLYENEGFICTGEKKLKNNYSMALYVYSKKSK
ncbi:MULTISPECIES: GNAT family N-acetyltransferase [Clostridium]|uniref:GNAT family N-acetyltransferase n=1 Tax=Clostridium TaxID=1485 RepID=UPI0008268342|nr:MULTISPECIES: GNAT family N-acetyltransferase [Clostridium]PJI08171.1 N-acetyltransferase [Clostridium sp. CT7]